MNKSSKIQLLCQAHHVLCCLFTILALTAAHPQEDNNIFFPQNDRNSGVGSVYYSRVVTGDFGSTLGYENHFYDYLQSRGLEPDITESYCFFEPTIAGA